MTPKPLALAFALLAACSAPASPRPGPPETPAGSGSAPASAPGFAPAAADDRVTVERVVDGDTIVVRRGAASVRVRLIGIDTPETVDPRRPAGCFGKQATAFARSLLGGKSVVLRSDVSRLDRFGRELAYVYLPDGTFVNLLLVRRGYARVLTVPPDVAHAAELVAAERAARAERLGLWDPAVCPVATG